MGGAVITNAAAGKDNVKALVYIAALVPDVGETRGPHQQVPRQRGAARERAGPVHEDRRDYRDRPVPEPGRLSSLRRRHPHARVLAPPTHPTALRRRLIHLPDDRGRVARHTSWGLAGRDKPIPIEAERWMYERANFRKIVELPTSSHVAMLSHRLAVADLIEDAARGTADSWRLGGTEGAAGQTL
jgi:hypothetical protein